MRLVDLDTRVSKVLIGSVEFIDVEWRHQSVDEPIRLVSELDAHRYETRKLEFFRNGEVGFASQGKRNSRCELGSVPVPLLSTINESPEFHAKSIDASDFESLWAAHVPD